MNLEDAVIDEKLRLYANSVQIGTHDDDSYGYQEASVIRRETRQILSMIQKTTLKQIGIRATEFCQTMYTGDNSESKTNAEWWISRISGGDQGYSTILLLAICPNVQELEIDYSWGPWWYGCFEGVLSAMTEVAVNQPSIYLGFLGN